MEFDDDKVDTSQLEDRRGQSASGGGGGLLGGGGQSTGGGGGGLGTAVVASSLGKAIGGGGITAAVLGLLFFFLFSSCQASSPSSTSGAGQSGTALSGTGTGSPSDMATRCTGGAIMQYDDCYVLKSFNEINEVWTSYFAAKNQKYVAPKLVYFNTGSVNTGGCGRASSETGPFYCPGDSKVYIDLGFMNQLFKQIGAQGRYAQTYVVAHEVGHHLQNILGIEKQVRQQTQQNPRRQNELSVKTELQADCFAGVYGRLANDQGNQKITAAEYQQALEAAAAVGDDRIQAGAGQRVRPESFTHGSAQQRQYWFERGFKNPALESCNTFAAQ